MSTVSHFNFLCPHCTTNVPSVTLINERERIINIKCNCRYSKDLSISSYLSNQKQFNSPCSEILYKCSKHSRMNKVFCQNCGCHLCESCSVHIGHPVKYLTFLFDDTLFDNQILNLNEYLLSIKKKGDSMINKVKEELENSYKSCYTMCNEIFILLLHF